jgi:carbonic anhydrase
MSPSDDASTLGQDLTAFQDLFEANIEFAGGFQHGELQAVAARGLAIITCMDSRIAPLDVMGLQPGDAKILRNAGGRVTDDVLRTLVLAVYLLGVTRVLVMPHTQCRMAQSTEEQIHTLIEEKHHVDTRSISFETIADPIQTLHDDVERIRSYAALPRDLAVTGAIYDVSTGELQPVPTPR